MTTKNAIEAAKITKKLKNFTLDVENFAIPQGFATALIGENGAGKTTLLNILAGIRLDYKGEITYFGQYSDKQKENSGDIKNRIGYTGPGKYYLPLGQNNPGILYEQEQGAVFLRCKVQGFSGKGRTLFGEVDFQKAIIKQIMPGCPQLQICKNRRHFFTKHCHRKGLSHIIRAADFISLEHIALLIIG